VKSVIKEAGIKRVIVTGYSLGAAVAALFALQHGEDLIAQGIDIRAITFGCPRMVDERDLPKLPLHITTRIINTYTEGDPIPMPLTSFVPGYRVQLAHVGNAVTIQDKGKGVILSDQLEQTYSEAHINPKNHWWSVDKWNRHLKETYEKFIKLTAVQLNFQLILEGSPSFLGYRLRDIATKALAKHAAALGSTEPATIAMEMADRLTKAFAPEGGTISEEAVRYDPPLPDDCAVPQSFTGTPMMSTPDADAISESIEVDFAGGPDAANCPADHPKRNTDRTVLGGMQHLWRQRGPHNKDCPSSRAKAGGHRHVLPASERKPAVDGVVGPGKSDDVFLSLTDSEKTLLLERLLQTMTETAAGNPEIAPSSTSKTEVAFTASRAQHFLQELFQHDDSKYATVDYEPRTGLARTAMILRLRRVQSEHKMPGHTELDNAYVA
jgi:pimeloyl-ACP methyl ester carboxylesterase